MSDNLSRDYLLDNSLKSKYKHTQFIDYSIQVIDSGDYKKIYIYDNLHSHNIDNQDKKDIICKKSNYGKFRSIELSNAIRSNNAVEYLAKANHDSWVSFVTLTFSENLTDLSRANKIFNFWISNIRKLKKDFKYLAVPEFQKRGAVHYHVLSNLSFDNIVITEQKIKKGKAINYNTLYDCKYWNYGFCRFDNIQNDKVKIWRYLTKYMIKDIDNRLFGKKRYFFSQNLIKPKKFLLKSYTIPDDFVIEYENEYVNYYNGENVKCIKIKKNGI